MADEDTTEEQELETQGGEDVDYKGKFEKYKALYHKTNKENAKRRKTNEELQNKLENLKTERNDYQSKYESLETKLNNQQKESKITKKASELGLDADLTIAHLQRKGKMDDIDDDTDLGSLLEQEVESKPNLKVNGAVNTGDTGDGNDTDSKSDFNKWVRGKLQ